MPLSEASILQKNKAIQSGSSVTASLGSGTTGGSTVLLIGFTAASGGMNLPAGFEQDYQIGVGGKSLYAWRRKDCPAGESSWTLVPVLSDTVVWFAYEVAGVDLTEPLETTVVNSGASVTSLSTGTTPSTSYTDLMCLAVHAALASTTISGQTNGFQNTATDGEIQQIAFPGTVAVSRLWPGASGTFETTATFGTTVTALGAMLVYRGVGALAVPPVATGVQVG